MDNESDHRPAAVSGNLPTFSITGGGDGDHDLGKITEPDGPPVAAVPTLPPAEWPRWPWRSFCEGR